MMKQKIYEYMLARGSEMEYIPWIQFQTSIINMEEGKEITMSNQLENKEQKRCQCGSIKHLRVSYKDYPLGLAIRKAKNWPWRWGYLDLKQRSQQKMQQKRKRANVWWQRPLVRVKNRQLR